MESLVLRFWLLGFIFVLTSIIIYSYYRNKKLKRKNALNSLEIKLSILQSRQSYKLDTVFTLYGYASQIVFEVIKDKYLKERERYNILYDLEELMCLHLYYRMRGVKNSKEFMQEFGSMLLDSKIEFISPNDHQDYLAVKKAAGIKGEAISLFWNRNQHFFYAILEERNYILKILKDERESNKEDGQFESDGYFFTIAEKLRQVISSHLTKYPNRATTNDLKLTLIEVEKILQ